MGLQDATAAATKLCMPLLSSAVCAHAAQQTVMLQTASLIHYHVSHILLCSLSLTLREYDCVRLGCKRSRATEAYG